MNGMAPTSPPDVNGGRGGNNSNLVTAITSRRNGKTTLAIAAVQTIEIRQRFIDGIAWLRVGRMSLMERDVRRLYEELYDQLLGGREDEGREFGNEGREGMMYSDDGNPVLSPFSTAFVNDGGDNDAIAGCINDENTVATKIVKSQRRYYGGELDALKEDLGRVLSRRRILIVLDDVWRPEDVQRFVFDTSYPLSVETNDDRYDATSGLHTYPPQSNLNRLSNSSNTFQQRRGGRGRFGRR